MELSQVSRGIYEAHGTSASVLRRAKRLNMPEGHTIHAAARKHDNMLKGRVVNLSSPQGRFVEGAQKLNGRECIRVEAYGKHLVYRFVEHYYLHIHLGLFGRIKVHKRPIKDAKNSVRVRLISATHVIDISGPTICELLRAPEIEQLIDRIGPDPLREDAEPERVFHRIRNSRVPIGKLLMDQSVIAGIGNIYRTELLWRQKLHPDIRGRDLNQKQLEALWDDAALLLNIGAKKNAILTTDIAIANPSKSREKFNIFAQKACPKCRGPITKIFINGRRAFICALCQKRLPKR